MTHDVATYEIQVEGDGYSISEWESLIQEVGDPSLDIDVVNCEVDE